MKTKITFLKASLVALFLFVSSTAWSATYYTCSGATLSLTTPVVTGITYTWDVKPAAGGASITGFPSATAPTTLPASGSYTVYLSSAQTVPGSGICPADVVENTFIVLPSLSIALVDPTHPSYCAANTTVVSSDITVTGPVLPSTSGSDLVLDYTYSVSAVTSSGTNVVDGTTVGTIDQATGKFTLTTLIPGVYTVTGKVKYKAAASPTNTLLGTGCEATSAVTKVITVIEKPTAPIITISAS
ncbi:hypothetical protein [Pedobacter sp. MC2016-24]|uniref:hypothetical protein n=1 Tax=Pedobacter sp. MC2016-24 TaxID=2780090 RepID=UPI00187EECA9|nr:hypothetical protein [Pedobacter sp. MC2016-24]MBE9600156.1 hypothetical protein [Pedobacter sp. MC2016-24]